MCINNSTLTLQEEIKNFRLTKAAFICFKKYSKYNNIMKYY